MMALLWLDLLSAVEEDSFRLMMIIGVTCGWAGGCVLFLAGALRRITREMATHDMAIKQNGRCEKKKWESCSTGQIAISDRPAPEEPEGEGCNRADHTIQRNRQTGRQCLNDSFEAPFFSSIETNGAGAHYMIVGFIFFLFSQPSC